MSVKQFHSKLQLAKESKEVIKITSTIVADKLFLWGMVLGKSCVYKHQFLKKELTV